MTRPLILTSRMHNLHFSTMPMIMSLFFVVVAVLSIFSIISFLCGIRKMKKKKKKHQTETEESTTGSKLNNNLSSKARSMVKLLCWRKVEAEARYDEEDYGDQDEQVLWRKNILMGERCRPIDFSGKILYDSKGNMLPDLSHHNEHQQHILY
ncbi:hypothetical protein Lalb_Chr17g0346181 [Lupinus albus]|uniref:Transmembrane protein n=1 Tax=Lupinus albus TaxID=3870 RepID=A0A6A4NV09_LUPAL|nr:hypothetical protein Lalb_Chr17g0346181 [Lupinus albus]